MRASSNAIAQHHDALYGQHNKTGKNQWYLGLIWDWACACSIRFPIP
jgi:hypothetical protein